MSKMNPEIKARWVAALRSGEYKQGKTVLRSGEECFCCLGVLTDLAAKEGVGEWTPEDGGLAYEFGARRDASLLPEEVREWAGFAYPARMGGEVLIGRRLDMLAVHNDSGTPFAEIAQAIEEQL